MKRIEIVFEGTKIIKNICDCSTAEILLASRILDVEATTNIMSAETKDAQKNELLLQTMLSGLKILMLPFLPETAESFDRDSAEKNLPHMLSMYIDNLEKQFKS